MIHEKRREELGKMIMDVAKYLATVGLIGSFLTNSLTVGTGLIIAIVVLLLTVMGFYTIPPKKGDVQ